ncbi:MAG: hypothetical protein ABIP49_02335 [Lysobacterales bacterium]
MPVFMLFRAPQWGDANAHARKLWDAADDDEPDVGTRWDAEARAGIARQIIDADRRVRADVQEGGDALCVSTETEPGVDYEVLTNSVHVEVDEPGLDLGRERTLLLETLDALDRIASRCGLLVWSEQLGRVIDPRRDVDVLEQHLAATRLAALPPRPVLRYAVVLFAVAAAVAVALAVIEGARG